MASDADGSLQRNLIRSEAYLPRNPLEAYRVQRWVILPWGQRWSQGKSAQRPSRWPAAGSPLCIHAPASRYSKARASCSTTSMSLPNWSKRPQSCATLFSSSSTPWCRAPCWSARGSGEPSGVLVGVAGPGARRTGDSPARDVRRGEASALAARVGDAGTGDSKFTSPSISLFSSSSASLKPGAVRRSLQPARGAACF